MESLNGLLSWTADWPCFLTRQSLILLTMRSCLHVKSVAFAVQPLSTCMSVPVCWHTGHLLSSGLPWWKATFAGVASVFVLAAMVKFRRLLFAMCGFLRIT